MSENDAQNEVLRSATIMMVDDEPTTLDVLETFLRGEGYENFVPIADSRTALTTLEERQPDVLLLDLMMPEVDGFQILRAVRRHPQLRQTPVIILTSSTDSPTKLKALELGATDFLGKPVDPSELALRLRNTLAAKAYRDRLAYYDGLTGLPNRRLFVERMGRLLGRVQREDADCAVMHLNLDRFQQINDALGREVGNSVLKAVGERLDRCVRPSDFTGMARFGGGRVLSRSGGDEFLLFLLDVGVADRVARVAERILAQLGKPYSVDGHELHVAASIGLALFPDDGGDVETLLGHASAALSHAKSSRRNGYQFYSEALNAECRERLHLEGQLRKAIDRQELVLHYQPKLEIASGRIAGAPSITPPVRAARSRSLPLDPSPTSSSSPSASASCS